MTTPTVPLIRILLATLTFTVAALAGEAAKKTFAIPAGEAVATFKQFGAQSGQQLIYSGDAVKGVTTNAVRGELTAREALDLMTAGTRLTVTEDRTNGALAVTRAPDPKALRAAPLVASARPTSQDPEAAVLLSPFEVATDRDRGFAASSAGTATRLALDMRDVPVAFTVMTGEFIEALAITNVGEAAGWMPNGSMEINRDDNQQPIQYTTRGIANMGLVGQQRNNYMTAGLLDSYSLERYEFGRGPNAALFNIGAQSSLAGGLGGQTKKARYDAPFDTIAVSYGSWDYKRTTVDVNRPLSDRLAVRGNAMWFDKGGWREGLWEKDKGITATASYLLAPKTELRIEGAYDLIQRNSDPNWIYDSISGWDGVTVFRGPITNAILGSQTAPGAPNSFGQILTFQGERQGVARRGEYYLWDPFSGQNMVMNYQNEGYTRRADETANTPILANGVLYVRGTGLPFGNGGGTTFPAINQNPGATGSLLYGPALPDDRYARAINGSAFRLPSKRYTASGFDAPIYTQSTRDINLALSHQIGNRWFFELGGDLNMVPTITLRGPANTIRTVRIDINQLLPNGAPNPHFLEPYGDTYLQTTYRSFKNRGVRGTAAYKLNAGKWGDYLFNLFASTNLRATDNHYRYYNTALPADPRMWQSSTYNIYIRQYWNDPSRPFDAAAISHTLSRNAFASDNNSYTTTTSTISPRWVLGDWNDTDEKFDNAVLSMSAKYFGGKLVVLGTSRFDRYSSRFRTRKEFGDLPADWDGLTKFYKPDAPADWATLSYIPRNATTGVATATIPIPAVTRPRINTLTAIGGTTPFIYNGATVGYQNGSNNGVQIPNPYFANDRFRNDYNPPVNKGSGLKGSYGFVYHVQKNVALVANYANNYLPPPTNAFTLDNQLAGPVTGLGYDVGVRLNFLDDRLTVNTNYFFNREDHQRVASPVTTAINNLLARNAASDPNIDGRNIQGIPDIFGTDYQSAKTSGVELEIVGNITRGWRVMFNLGTAKVFTFNRYPLTKTFVPENAAAYRQVLEDAGGRLDTTQHPNGAPGLAVVNPAVVAAIASEQSNAVIDYNNIWSNYALVQGDAPIPGQDRMTINAFSDYTVQTGRLKGLRFGWGGQWAGREYVGSRSGDSIADPANPTAAIDDPKVDQTTPIYVRRPVVINATFGYSLRLKGGTRWQGKELSFRLLVKNVLNNQMVIPDGFGVIARPPNGDYSKPNRVTVPAGGGTYTEPTSFIFTTTLKL